MTHLRARDATVPDLYLIQFPDDVDEHVRPSVFADDFDGAYVFSGRDEHFCRRFGLIDVRCPLRLYKRGGGGKENYYQNLESSVAFNSMISKHCRLVSDTEPFHYGSKQPDVETPYHSLSKELRSERANEQIITGERAGA